MSTYYYPFKHGITSVRLSEGPEHDRLEVWQRHGKCGELVVDRGTGRYIAQEFCSCKPLLRTGFGGAQLGVVVETLLGSADLKSSEYLWGDNGQVYTVEEIRQMAGKGRTASKEER